MDADLAPIEHRHGWNYKPGMVLTGRNRINEIVRERRGISADTALRLERYFGTSHQFWLNLQASYDVQRAKDEAWREIAKIKPREAA